MLFLVGSAAPGRDGVGDYTRDLADELATLSIPCEVIALADAGVTAPVSITSPAGVPVLRLPAQLSWQERVNHVAERRAVFKPAWVSLQYVPFSFHRRGVPYALVRSLPALCGDARLHVMCHELWIGHERSLRRLVTGAAQRWILRRICSRSAMVHTTNTPYQRLLAADGIAAHRLPLFGSVPIETGDLWDWLAPQLTDRKDATGPRTAWWIFVLFGALHPSWPPQPLLDRLCAVAAAAGRQVAILSAGRIAAGATLWNALTARYGDRIRMLRVGELPPDKLSQLFNTADFGISTTSLSLLGKSAATTAMFEHGLPIIVNREDGFPSDTAIGDINVDRVIRVDDEFAQRLQRAPRVPAASRRRDVALKFAEDLEHATLRGAA